jgi:hypothetical protein
MKVMTLQIFVGKSECEPEQNVSWHGTSKMRTLPNNKAFADLPSKTRTQGTSWNMGISPTCREVSEWKFTHTTGLQGYLP